MNDGPKLKQLDWLQATMTRMAGNSFLLKGWTVTITAALLTLSAKEADRAFALLATYPTLVFWALDGYYLHLERKFRIQFETIASTLSVGLGLGKALAGQRAPKAYLAACCAPATWPIYVAILVVVALIAARGSLL